MLLSFGAVQLDFITMNIDSISTTAVRLLCLDGIDSMRTALYIVIGSYYQNMLDLDSDDPESNDQPTGPLWIQANMSDLKQATIDMAAGLLQTTNLEKWAYAHKSLHTNKILIAEQKVQGNACQDAYTLTQLSVPLRPNDLET
jgi:hypothetical protein